MIAVEGSVLRILVIGVCLVLLVTACSAPASSDREVGAMTTSNPSTTTVAPIHTTTTTSSMAAVGPTSGPTSGASHALEVVFAPAEGQWFTEVPIPWVFARWPALSDDEEDVVMGAKGWTGSEAVVTINGMPTEQEWCQGCMSQGGHVLAWEASDREGDLSDWPVGQNSLVIRATFVDGTVVEETRTFHYDPDLDAFTGWMVDLDETEATITIAASTYAAAAEDGADTGPVSSVIAYPVRDDAVFVLLDVDSSGQPPSAAIGFEEFADLVVRADAGDCGGCFYASWADRLFAAPDAEHGAQYFLVYTRAGEIQQLEQIWSP